MSMPKKRNHHVWIPVLIGVLMFILALRALGADSHQACVEERTEGDGTTVCLRYETRSGGNPKSVFTWLVISGVAFVYAAYAKNHDPDKE